MSEEIEYVDIDLDNPPALPCKARFFYSVEHNCYHDDVLVDIVKSFRRNSISCVDRDKNNWSLAECKIPVVKKREPDDNTYLRWFRTQSNVINVEYGTKKQVIEKLRMCKSLLKITAYQPVTIETITNPLASEWRSV